MIINRPIEALMAVMILLACPALLANDNSEVVDTEVTIPEVNGTFTLYPSHRPDDKAKFEEWLASGKVLESGWKGKISNEQHLAFVGKPNRSATTFSRRTRTWQY